MMTREDMLRELELLPLWRLRKTSTKLEFVKSVVANSKDVKETAIILPSNIKVDEVIVETATELKSINEPELMLRLLVSADANWLFLLEYSIDSFEEETLLQNMLRAVSVITNVDIMLIELQQLIVYQPKLMVVFGDALVKSLLGDAESFEDLRLKQHQKQLVQYNAIPTIVTYHPRYLLQHLNSKAKAWDDLSLAIQYVQQT